jgi:membrane protein DedA with SNARE-associated domain
MDSQHIIDIIREYGAWSYPITFAGSFIEGESFVVAAAFLAAQGVLNAPLLLASAWLGCACNDQCYFWLGRRYGLRLLERRPAWRDRVDRALAWMRRFEAGFILTYRFLYGVRNISSFALGISGIGWRRFSALNFVAAGLWASVFMAGGYFCGRAFRAMLGNIAEAFGLALLAGLLLFGAGFAIASRLRQRRRRAEAALSALRK